MLAMWRSKQQYWNVVDTSDDEMIDAYVFACLAVVAEPSSLAELLVTSSRCVAVRCFFFFFESSAS